MKATWVALAVTQIPLLLAQDGGFFNQEGLDVSIDYVAGSQNGVAALVAGDTQFLDTAASAVVSAYPGGARLTMVAGFVNHPVFIAMTVPSLTDPGQLKGTSWAVTGLGTSDYFGLLSMLDHFGLSASDVKIVAANNTTGQIAAIANGSVQGILVSPPNDIQAQKSANLHAFFDTATLGEEEQNAGIAVTQSYLQAHPDLVQRFVAACVLGMRRFAADKQFAEQVMAKYLKYTAQDVLDSGWTHYKDVFEKVPYPTEPGVQRVIDQVSAQNAKVKSVKPTDVIDRSTVQALEQQGFFATGAAAQPSPSPVP